MRFVTERNSFMGKPMIAIEVVYALADKQELLRLTVPQDTTVRQAAVLSGMDGLFPGLDLAAAPLGIFGKAIPKPDERVLEGGERVEIYRPLLVDPKEVRKQRAAKAAQNKAAESRGESSA
jgi:putative ubiquitin-RnfH superfamily antitoxin RatB of RatAB toxin-antitoxin module